jgi:hypothetical protein
MLGKILTAKYSDPESPIVDVQINDFLIPNTLMTWEIPSNVMKRKLWKILDYPTYDILP